MAEILMWVAFVMLILLVCMALAIIRMLDNVRKMCRDTVWTLAKMADMEKERIEEKARPPDPQAPADGYKSPMVRKAARRLKDKRGERA